MQDLYDMSWAEFVLRSIGFKKEQERKEELTRAVAYQSYRAGFVFSKENPLPIDRFWKIGSDEQTTIPDAIQQRMIKETAEWAKKVKKK